MQVRPSDIPNLPPPAETAALRKVADELEAAFLAEVLKHADIGKTPEGFGGGEGEDQFASFLIEAQAKEIVRAGGIGLSEHLFRSLQEDGTDAE